MIRVLVNVAGFYLGWFACVLSAARGQPLLGPAVVAAVLSCHLALSPARGREAVLILVITLTGLVIDSIMLTTGVVRFAASTVVSLAWFGALWANFAAILTVSLRWLARAPWIALALGAVGGPATYYAGAQLGAIGLNDELWISMTALAVEWGVMIPVLSRIADNWHRGLAVPARSEGAQP